MSQTTKDLRSPRVDLGSHPRGFTRVRFMRVRRDGTRHELHDWTVDVNLTGAPAQAPAASDAIENVGMATLDKAVHHLAHQSGADSMEVFAQELINLLLRHNPQVTDAEVTIQSHLWKRLVIAGEPHPGAFMKGSDERQTTRVTRSQDQSFAVRSGFRNMTVLKMAGADCAWDTPGELPPGPETAHLLFGMEITTEWIYSAAALASGVDFNKLRRHLRERIIETFSGSEILDPQKMLAAMAEAALKHTDLLQEISLRMPSRPIRPVDLAQLGLESPNAIFTPTEEPHEMIEATMRRG